MIAETYLGEIRLFSFGFTPQGWHSCDGTILQISQYAALYSLLGNAYGGDGVATFALPDLRGRAKMGAGENSGLSYFRGQKGGMETVNLTTQKMPAHSHPIQVDNAIGTAGFNTNYLAIPQTPAAQGSVPIHTYNPDITAYTTLNSDTLEDTGMNHDHNNLQPYQTLNFCIALDGYYPPRP